MRHILGPRYVSADSEPCMDAGWRRGNGAVVMAPNSGILRRDSRASCMDFSTPWNPRFGEPWRLAAAVVRPVKPDRVEVSEANR
jgi:hypothetical protein